MADRAQEVAVRRAGEEVEIIPATLQRPGQHQGLAGNGSGPPFHMLRPQESLGGEVGHNPQVEGWVSTHFKGAAVRVKTPNY